MRDDICRQLVRSLYHIALERGFEEAVVTRLVVLPLMAMLKAADGLERRWTTLLGGGSTEGRMRHDSSGGMP